MRHRFEDSFNMNILNWKINQKNNTVRTWSSQRAEFKQSYITFAAKIWIRKLYISNSKYFIYLLYSWRVLVLIFLLENGRNLLLLKSFVFQDFNPTCHLNKDIWETFYAIKKCSNYLKLYMVIFIIIT